MLKCEKAVLMGERPIYKMNDCSLVLLIVIYLFAGALGCQGSGDEKIHEQIPSYNYSDDSKDTADSDSGNDDDIGDVREEENGVDADIIAPEEDTQEEEEEQDSIEDAEESDIDDDVDNSMPQLVNGPCGVMLSYGVLEWGENVIELDFSQFDGQTSTSCAGLESDRVAIIELSAPHSTPGILSIPAQAGLVAEIRRGNCDVDGLSYGCTDEDLALSLQPMVRHYLLLAETEQNTTGVREVLLNLEEMESCVDETSVTSCIDGARLQACHTLQASPDLPRRFTVACPNGTCENDRCQGDNCQNPISVTSTFSWTGSNMGFVNFHDRAQEIGYADQTNQDPTCLAIGEELGQPLATRGRELVFHLPDVQEGQLLSVDVETIPPFVAVVYLKQSCDESAACAAVWTAEEMMTFDIVEGGDYFLFVDSIHDVDIHFDISIRLETP